MQALIDLLTRLLPSGYKTYGAAIIAALLAANAALASQGIVFLPEQAITILTYLAAALGLVGIRHAIAKAEAAGVDPFYPGRKLALMLALGLGMACAMGCGGKDSPPLVRGCKCCLNNFEQDCCLCGPRTDGGCTPGNCICKPGNKCRHQCPCAPAVPKPAPKKGDTGELP